MFETHAHLDDISSPTDVLWRYVDFSRFVDLLQTCQLHLARADSMADDWEGSYSHANLRLRPEVYGEGWPVMAGSYANIYMRARTHTYLNCWHLSDVESAAMWAIYDRESRGVAIATTRARLAAAITEVRPVYGTTVEYVDYQNVWIPERNVMEPFRFKRMSFAHEREYRLVAIWNPKAELRPGGDPSNEADVVREPDVPPEGLKVAVQLDDLVQEVRVSPHSPTWHRDVIRRTCEKYERQWTVSQSDLAAGPIF